MKSDIIFETLQKTFPQVKTEFKGRIGFKIKEGAEWTLDFDKRIVEKGLEKNNTTFEIYEDDFIQVSKGQTNLRFLFMRRKLFITGDYANCIRFPNGLFPKMPLL